MKQEQETITKTIDETLLIPILGKGKKLYHYTQLLAYREFVVGNFGSQKEFFKRHNGISSGD